MLVGREAQAGHAEDEGRHVLQHLLIHRLDTFGRVLRLGHDDRIPTLLDEELYPSHIELHQGRATPLSRFEKDDADRLPLQTQVLHDGEKEKLGIAELERHHLACFLGLHREAGVEGKRRVAGAAGEEELVDDILLRNLFRAFEPAVERFHEPCHASFADYGLVEAVVIHFVRQPLRADGVIVDDDLVRVVEYSLTAQLVVRAEQLIQPPLVLREHLFYFGCECHGLV